MADFGYAIGWLHAGQRVARKGWNGKGMWLTLVDPIEIKSPLALEISELAGKPVKLLPWIGMKTADDCFVPWLSSQTDSLATDWLVVE